jgi:hypothetical protein
MICHDVLGDRPGLGDHLDVPISLKLHFQVHRWTARSARDDVLKMFLDVPEPQFYTGKQIPKTQIQFPQNVDLLYQGTLEIGIPSFSA